MAVPLEEFHYHVAQDRDDGPRSPASFRAGGPAGIDVESLGPVFNSNEAAARYYLDELLQQDSRPAMRSVVEPDAPQRVPGLVIENDDDLRRLGTHQVRFAQTQHQIPIFGASAVVELTGDRDLVSVNARLDEVTGVDPVERLSRAEALQRVAIYAGAEIPPDAALGGELNFFKDEDTGAWHLVWFLKNLPARPAPDGAEPADGHGLGARPVPRLINYLVDAHSGEIVFTYSANPTAGAPIPAKCKGMDENGVTQTFFGRLDTGTVCLLDDPLRSVRTFDLRFSDIDTDPPVPPRAVEAATSDFADSNRAAVSAHLNASRVQDFYKVVLQRDGIDDQGMLLMSMVNTTAARMEAPPTLKNAFWWSGRMWYGQVRDTDGRLVSLSRFLDVIGHELTHGVIETTSNLVYATQSGALNESFADVAGILINNWYTADDREDVSTWSWKIGDGLRPDGRPLRNFANPGSLGHPAHMKDFRQLAPGQLPNPDTNDNGWVHFNSNIANKAVHNLLTIEVDGARVFTVEDVAVLTYLGMSRLSPRATFADALQGIVDVAMTYFGGGPDRDAKVASIREAYRLVGIS
jgi:bacillolysin